MSQLPKQDSLVDYLEIMRRRRWSIIIPAVAIVALSIPIIILIPRTYRSTTLIMVEAQKVPQEFVRATVTTPVEDRLKTIGQQILSRTRLERVIEEFGLYRGKEESPRQAGKVSLDMVERMQRNIEILVKGGSMFSVSYTGADPTTVMNVTNKLASLFIEENLKTREEQAEGTTEFLENELQQVKTRLEEQEEQLRAFKEQYMGELPGQLDTNLRTLDRLQAERQRLQDSLRTAEDRYNALSQQIAVSLPEGERSASALAVHLQMLRSRLANLRTEYKDEYPDILLLKNEIKAIETELKTQPKNSPPAVSTPNTEAQFATFQMGDLQREIRAIKQRQQEVALQITAFEQRVERTPLREQQLTQVLRDYENVRKTYQTLLDKRQDARIAESLERRQKGELFRVLDPANFPEKPYKPNRTQLMLLALGLGVGVGIGIAVFRENLDASIKGEADLIDATAGVPLLASVPFVVRKTRRPSRATVPVIAGGRAAR